MSSYKTALDIVQSTEDSVPMLVDDLLPQKGLAAIAGESDSGKSTWLRQLGLSVSIGEETFLGRTLNTVHNRVLYVSTEDAIENIGPGLKVQVEILSDLEDEALSNYYFLDDLSEFQNTIRELSEDQRFDLIIIDCFSDFIKKDMNSATEVRNTLSYLNRISNKLDCLILVLHHVRKSAIDNQSASKSDILGSTGFEGKMRAVLMLINGMNEYQKRLRIVKANYLDPAVKQRDLVLKFQNRVFELIGDSQVQNIDPVAERNDKAIEIIESFLPRIEQGEMIKDLFDEAKKQGYPFGKSKFYEQIKEMSDN